MRKVKAFIVAFSLVIACLVVDVPRVEAASNSQLNLYQKVFDYTYYVNAYPDVVAEIGNNSQILLLHYINNGVAESRSASAFFNLTAYANRYPELMEAFGTDFDAYVNYYVTTGVFLGQNASADDNYLTPEIQADLVNRMKYLLGSCTTIYDATIARATNVELAASNINGTIVQPGETFSYSKTVGPRTQANGFVMAPIFLSGQHGMGIGGGICQVSSTLYTAMINANIAATERHAHSLPVAYLPAGYDATISGNSLDLKFKNTLSNPIYINSSASNGYLTITLIMLDNEETE